MMDLPGYCTGPGAGIFAPVVLLPENSMVISLVLRYQNTPGSNTVIYTTLVLIITSFRTEMNSLFQSQVRQYFSLVFLADE